MKTFDKPGPQHTDETILTGLARARELGAPIVASTNSGASGARLCALAREQGFTGPVVVVTHAYGSRAKGVNILMEEHRAAMESSGARLVTAAHVLSGAERGISTVFKGAYPVEIMAHTLRLFGQGVKVTVEIGVMAMDAGAIPYGTPAVCLGGTVRGLDTAVVLSPSYASCILETKIHEILCKPY